MNYKNRSSRGFTMIEMLISCTIMTIGILALCSFMVINSRYSAGSANKIDNINACNMAIQRLSRDIRQARSIGDVYGAASGTPTNPQPVQGSASFPSNNDPLYGNGQIPASGGWPWTGPPYTCSGDTLVIQVPIFDRAVGQDPNTGSWGPPFGLPTGVWVSTGMYDSNGNPMPPHAEDNVETHIYKVVPDTDPKHSTEYVLQMSKIPGAAVASAVPPYDPTKVSSTPQTICRGIVGPISGASTTPQIFQYLNRSSLSNPTFAPTADQDVPDYSGLCVNMEIMHEDNDLKQPKVLAIKAECFMRNNALATSTGQPSNITGAANHAVDGQ